MHVWLTLLASTVWQLDLQLSVQSVHITTNVASSNPQKQTVIHKTTHTTKHGATQTPLRTSDEIKVCINMV
jgi:hypothetical protein